MYESFEKYMNKPEKPVDIIGKLAKRTDYLICDITYKIVDIIEKGNKWYALCEYTDDFSEEVQKEEIYLGYLEVIK